MRSVSCITGLAVLSCLPLSAQETFDVPLRIAMGGVTTVDSLGRTWLGEGVGVADPLNIRPNDLGGGITAENWSLLVLNPDSLLSIGYDPSHPGDQYIFNSIRWDDGNAPPDFLMEIPISNGEYSINMYFNEACCPQRHFKIEVEGEILDDDVNSTEYGPTLGYVGKKTFDGIVVEDGILHIGLLPCRECPGATDVNAIIDALEVVSGPGCDNLGLDFNCAFDGATGEVVGTWKPLAGDEGYRVLKNGAPFGPDLPPEATSFADPSPGDGGPIAVYTLQALDGGVAARECRANVKTFICARDLVCVPTPGVDEVAMSWSPAVGGVTGYELRRNGALVATLPPTATSYEDQPGDRLVEYRLKPLGLDLCGELSSSVVVDGVAFDTPLRINMGGSPIVDSKGRLWLGDGVGPDPLGIRPDDAGGANLAVDWFLANFQADSLTALGFDPTHPGDIHMFNSIRWDDGALPPDYRLEIPVPSEDYFLTLYFSENCCPNRHFQLELQGVIIDDDVSYLDYDALNPVIGRAGKMSFPVSVTDGLLRIGLLPCPQCPGATDTNAILQALELLPGECTPGFRQCPTAMACTPDQGTGEVLLSWSGPLCMEPGVDLLGYEVRRNGELLASLPPTAIDYLDTPDGRVNVYEVTPQVPAAAPACPPMRCTGVVEALAFDIPLRINMGGRTVVDSRGRTWWGDGPGTGDPLAIRLDDLSGVNTIENWCPVQASNNEDALRSLGLDPLNANDRYIMNTIRWDNGADLIDYRLELPVADGTYQLNLYFNECGGINRHFQIEIQGDLYDDDVSYLDYDPLRPESGRVGRLTFDGIAVGDGLLKIALLPCPTCPDPLPVDTNAILNAIEVLPADNINRACPRSLVTSVDLSGNVNGLWTPAENVVVDGYDLYRNGEKIASLPGNVLEFTDSEPLCARAVVYELQPIISGDSFCPGQTLRSVVIDVECPFTTPLRINMGGIAVIDSKGDLWLGDGPGVGDPLAIRPEDAGGDQSAENWSAGVFQPDSLAALGWNPAHPGDSYVFNTIRWDVGATFPDFRLEIPLDDGIYTVNMYFNEGCCPLRHFQIEVQGAIVDDDVSYLDYDPAAPALGKVGRKSYEGVAVNDGILRVAFLPCPLCPGVADINPIIQAIEVFSTGGLPDPPTGLVATAGNGTVGLTWNASPGVIDGYNVYRGPTATGPFTQINTTTVAAPAYTDTGLANGVEQCYVVTVLSGGTLESAFSSSSCATPAGGVTFRRGDPDASGLLDLSDAIGVLQHLFLGGPKPVCWDAADTDDNGAVDISDPIANLQYQFLGGPAPAAPGPFACGSDPNAEVPELGCDQPCA